MRITRMFVVVLVVALGAGAPVSGKELTIGLAAAPASMDPHVRNFWPNDAAASHIFDALVRLDEKQHPVPGLAAAWYAVDGTTWEFRLREGVRFHDGSPFTVDDVIFSFERASRIGDDASGFRTYTRGKRLIKMDDYTLRIKTDRPEPLMPQIASAIRIVSDRIPPDTGSSQFNTGAAAVGTGPYRFVEFIPGDRLVLERNEAYWGNKPEWTRVTLKTVASAASRVSALESGELDVIEKPPAADIGRLKRSPSYSVSQIVSHRLIYLHTDQFREESPFVKAKDGSSIRNPLLDPRVRKAMSLAIDRNAIVEKTMQGAAIGAGQLVPAGFFGRSPALLPTPRDPDGARKLLSEAGFAGGFRLTIHGPNDRYVNDAGVATAVAGMLTEVGIETDAVTMPQVEYFPRASRGGPHGTPEFSVILAGWGSDTGEASSPLKSLLHTYDLDQGFGTSNRGRHSDPEVDRLIEQALATLNDSRRYALLAEATELAIGRNHGIIPLHFQVNTWVARKGIRYRARTDERTLAYGAYSE